MTFSPAKQNEQPNRRGVPLTDQHDFSWMVGQKPVHSLEAMLNDNASAASWSNAATPTGVISPRKFCSLH